MLLILTDHCRIPQEVPQLAPIPPFYFHQRVSVSQVKTQQQINLALDWPNFPTQSSCTLTRLWNKSNWKHQLNTVALFLFVPSFFLQETHLSFPISWDSQELTIWYRRSPGLPLAQGWELYSRRQLYSFLRWYFQLKALLADPGLTSFPWKGPDGAYFGLCYGQLALLLHPGSNNDNLYMNKSGCDPHFMERTLQVEFPIIVRCQRIVLLWVFQNHRLLFPTRLATHLSS